MTTTEKPHYFVEHDGQRYDFGEKDWGYLANKRPDSNHELQAAVISQLSGIDISPEQCMALLAMHRFIQKSEANQQRQGYRGRTIESVVKGAATLAERLADQQGMLVTATVGGVVAEAAPGEAAEIVETPEEKPAPRRRRAPAAKK